MDQPRFLVLVLGALTLANCGGGGSPTSPGSGASPSVNATPAGPSSPSPTPDPRAGLPPGPIVTFTIALRSIDGGNFEYREPTQDPETGRWVVYIGEFVVIDSNPRNGAGQVCTYVSDPEYTIRDSGGAIARKGSSNPFLLRFDVAGRGDVDVSARIDGVSSNTLNLVAKGNNQR